MNVSSVGSNPYVYVPPTAHKPASTAAPVAAQSQSAAPVDADGDHDSDTAAGDRLDVRG